MSSPNTEVKEEVSQDAVEELEAQIIQVTVVLPEGIVVTIPGGILVSDTADYLRNVLQEIKETCHITSYSFQVVDGENVIPVNEFVELGEYIGEGQTTMQMNLVLDSYTVRKARDNMKRCRDLIKFPNYVQSGIAKEENEEESKENASTAASTADAAAKDPKKLDITADDFLKVRVESIGSFYDELLSRTGNPDPICVSKDSESPNYFIKSICESGWNPVQPARAQQGDLLYIEIVTATEGVLQVTCNARGFFVNRSSRNSFDGRPAADSCFNHELLNTVLSASSALNKAWRAQDAQMSAALQAIKESRSEVNQQPLDTLATLVTQGRLHHAIQAKQWNKPPANCCGIKTAIATYDLANAIDNASDRFGVDMPGPPHDWNEDMQMARSVPNENLQQRILRSKIIYKTAFDFTNACEDGMRAIAEGHITAFNPMDPIETQVFLYNGIFFSGAVDVTDTFKIATGEVACRKYAGHDLKNQQKIQSLEIDGLQTVLQVVMDYKGTRMVAQTVIPGVLAASGGASRLLAGTIEPGKRLSMKNEAYDLLSKLGEKAQLTERNVSAIPFVDPATADALVEDKSKFALGIDMGLEDPPTPIRVDDEDEKVSKESTSLPHVGPIEIKLIKGSDNRIYVLELARITPRDANFVKTSSGGTKVFSDEYMKDIDEKTATAYLLRREIIDAYLKYDADQENEEIIKRYVDEEKERKEVLAKALEAKKGEKKDDDDENKDKEEKKEKDPLIVQFEKEQETSSVSLIEEMQAVKAAAASRAAAFRINPNVFFDGLLADIDNETVKKDEQVARDVSLFLYEKMCPSITRGIRQQEHMPLDCEAAHKLLHNAGINMRYLGHMARLARTAEIDDIQLRVLQEKMNIQRMPTYWRDLLEIEMISRAVKIYINKLFSENPEIKTCPGPTIASVFSAILSITASNSNSNDNTVKESKAEEETATESLSKGAKKNKNKKMKKLAKSNTTTTQSLENLSINVATDAAKVIEDIDNILKTRFLYSLNEIRRIVIFDAIPSDHESYKHLNVAEYEMELSGLNGPLGKRFARPMVLRRMCQQTGVCIVTRDYKWDDNSSCMNANDIVDLTVRTKSCVPKIASVDADALLIEAENMIKGDDLPNAYQTIQQSNQILNQIVGNTHTQVALGNNTLSNVLRAAGDPAMALAITQKNLLSWVQLCGLDSTEAVSCHLKLASLHCAVGTTIDAIPHILSARYAVELMGGISHPLMAEVLQNATECLSSLPDTDPNTTFALICHLRDNNLSMINQAYFRIMAAGLLRNHGQLERAVNEMKHAEKDLTTIYGKEDSKVKEVSAQLKEYIREITTLRVYEAKLQQQEGLLAKRALAEKEAAKFEQARKEALEKTEKAKRTYRQQESKQRRGRR
jgi:protein TIF31